MCARQRFGLLGLGLGLTLGCAGSPVEAAPVASQPTSETNDESSGGSASSTTGSPGSPPNDDRSDDDGEDPSTSTTTGVPTTSDAGDDDEGDESDGGLSSTGAGTGGVEPPEETGSTSDGDGDPPAEEDPWGPGRIPENCGWDPQDEWYACDNHGLSPVPVNADINCPAGLAEGDPCPHGAPSFRRFGCCDAQGDTWYCSGSNVVVQWRCDEP